MLAYSGLESGFWNTFLKILDLYFNRIFVSTYSFILLDIWIQCDRNFVPVVNTAAVSVVVGILWLDIPGRVESLKMFC